MTNVSLDSSQMIKQMGMIEQGVSEAHVTFDKSFYRQSDVALIKARIDNSKCDKELKEIVVRLTRSIEYLSLPGSVSQIYDVLTEQKFDGVGERSLQERTFQIVVGESLPGDKKVIKENDWNHMFLEPEDIIL